MGNHLPEWTSSNFSRNLDRALDIRFVVNHSSQKSNQLDPDQKYEWLGYIGTKGWGTIEIIPSSISFEVLHLHMIKMVEHCCVDVKTCVQNTKPEFCCDHSAWDIVLRADAIQWANVVIP